MDSDCAIEVSLVDRRGRLRVCSVWEYENEGLATQEADERIKHHACIMQLTGYGVRMQPGVPLRAWWPWLSFIHEQSGVILIHDPACPILTSLTK